MDEPKKPKYASNREMQSGIPEIVSTSPDVLPAGRLNDQESILTVHGHSQKTNSKPTKEAQKILYPNN